MAHKGKRTAEERAAASAAMKEHWQRCREAAELLDLSAQEVNRAWDIIGPYSQYLGEPATRREVLEDVFKKYPRLAPAGDLEGRIKIMLWAIRKCGGVEDARDALARAAVALGGPFRAKELDRG